MASPATDGMPLALPSALNIRNILASRDLIAGALERNAPVLLDIPDDAQVDLSFVQLVLSARAQAGTGGVALARPASGELLDVLRRGGFLEGMSADAAHFWLHQEKI